MSVRDQAGKQKFRERRGDLLKDGCQVSSLKASSTRVFPSTMRSRVPEVKGESIAER